MLGRSEGTQASNTIREAGDIVDDGLCVLTVGVESIAEILTREVDGTFPLFLNRVLQPKAVACRRINVLKNEQPWNGEYWTK